MTTQTLTHKLFAVFLATCWLLASQTAFSQTVPVNGTVVSGNTPLCALVLVNGQNQFSCGDDGSFDLQAPPDDDGLLTIQVFADGFAPFRETFSPAAATNRRVEMRRASGGRVMNVASTFEDAGNGRALVSGTVSAGGGTPLCAFVLANGEQMFACDDSLGRFELNVPLDTADKVKLQVFAFGFNPYVTERGIGDDPIEPPPAAGCTELFTESDVYVVNLSQDVVGGASCNFDTDREATAACIENRIRAEFADTPGCLAAFDVFVPGTNQEDGNYQQFTKIVSPGAGRAYLSVQYSEEATLVDDTIQYDKGVYESQNALDDLLYTLKVHFDTTDIRVFGHSKGSDSVARVSTFPEHDEIEFYAFGQAARTPDSIRGRAGYIKKMDDNLVTVTWQNDEVKFYEGGQDGFQTPELWGFPGYVNQAGGGLSAYPSRLDHHNTYGGDYTKEDLPYCAAGNKSAYLVDSECKKQPGVRYLPYFWGNDECSGKAFELMKSGFVGEEYYVGYSGPRAAGCKDTISNISASYELTYLIAPADQDDCRYNMSVSFKGLEFGTTRSDGGSISVSTTRDTGWVTKRGTVSVPPHMRLELDASMDDVSGIISKCDVPILNSKSEGYIHKLAVTFTHPETGQAVTRTLIGNGEGIEYLPGTIQGKNNVAWRKTGGEWDLHYGIPPLNASRGGIMVKGDTEGNIDGEFYKWVHLLD